MFDAFSLGYLNGGGYDDELLNMVDLGPQACVQEYVPHPILTRTVSDEQICF